MQFHPRPVTLIAAAMAMTALCPQAAFALSIEATLCSVTVVTPLVPMMRAEPEKSRLEIMRLQQAGQAAVATPVIMPQAAVQVTSPQCAPGMGSAGVIATDFLAEPFEERVSSADKPDIFGSVALPISHTPLDVKWRAAARSSLAKRSGPWAPLLRSASGQGRAEQIQAVNQWVNARISFSDDRRDGRGADRWSGASETLRRRRGDCEDYAIAKMKLLEAVGFDRSDMYLVVVDDLVRRADHALLVVRLGQQMLVLDNGTDEMLDARDAADYRPVFSYSAAGTWIHGYAEPTIKMAAI